MPEPPVLEKKWFRRKVKMYGALKYPAILNIVQIEEIEQEVTEAYQEPTSATPYPPPPPGVPQPLQEATNMVFAA